MTEPASFDPAVTPSVTLNGKNWPVPPMVWRQLARCRAQLIELNSRLSEKLLALTDVEGENQTAHDDRTMDAVSGLFENLSNADFERLVRDVIYVGLTGAQPQLTRDEFDGWTYVESDMQVAWLVMRRQSGLFVFRKDTSAGEGAGALPPPNQTGSE